MKTGLIVKLIVLLLLCAGFLSGLTRPSPGPAAAPAAAPAATTEPDYVAAMRRMQLFFAAWSDGRAEDMSALCVQDPDGQTLDRIAALTQGLVPVEYTVNNASPSADGEEQVFSVTLTVRREDGNDPMEIELQPVMRLLGGEWYLQADSLAPLQAR